MKCQLVPVSFNMTRYNKFVFHVFLWSGLHVFLMFLLDIYTKVCGNPCNYWDIFVENRNVNHMVEEFEILRPCSDCRQIHFISKIRYLRVSALTTRKYDKWQNGDTSSWTSSGFFCCSDLIKSIWIHSGHSKSLILGWQSLVWINETEWQAHNMPSLQKTPLMWLKNVFCAHSPAHTLVMHSMWGTFPWQHSLSNPKPTL